MLRHESRCALRRPHERKERDIRKLTVDLLNPLLATATDLRGRLLKGMAEMGAEHERQFRQRIRFDVQTNSRKARFLRGPCQHAKIVERPFPRLVIKPIAIERRRIENKEIVFQSSLLKPTEHRNQFAKILFCK